MAFWLPLAITNVLVIACGWITRLEHENSPAQSNDLLQYGLDKKLLDDLKTRVYVKQPSFCIYRKKFL